MTDYTISDAKYAKGKKIISSAPNGTGYKTRVHRLAEALGGKWVHRSEGYTVSPRQAEQFEKLYIEGWDAFSVSRKLIPPKTEKSA